jgi:histidinol-phosphate aminotransferase
MIEHPQPTRLVRSLPATVPFVGPETQERSRGRPFRARIGANESVFGPSPNVVAAIRDAAPDMWMYCDPENHDLRVAVAAKLGIGKQNISIGEGIDGLLGTIVRMFVESDTPVVTSLGAYPTFNYHVAGFGGRLVTVPYRNDKEDLAGLLDAVKRENAPLVYISNPDNPMGTWWDAREIEALADALPKTTMLVLDEAYCETAPESALPPITPLRPNILRLRTFSKAYGLAGLRCGYVFAAESAIAVFDRIRSHFGVNRMAQIAALSALADNDYLQKAISEIAQSRANIASIAERHQLVPIKSATNFVAIDCGNATRAGAIMTGLLERDIFVRKPGVPQLDRCIRVSAGKPEDLEMFEAALHATLADIRA